MSKLERVIIEMSAERREQWKLACEEIIDVLTRRVTPAEAHAVLQLCLCSLEATYEIAGTVIIDAPRGPLQ